MRLHILSDLHLEFGPLDIPVVDADIVVLAGDTHLGRNGVEWALEHFPSQPVIYLCGNHEFYRHSFPDLIDELKGRTRDTNIHVLENDVVEICGYTILGCTLWTDFASTGKTDLAMATAGMYMTDYQIIEFGPDVRVLRPQDTARAHAKSVAWLRDAIKTCDPHRTVVVTHHAPSCSADAPYHADSPLKPAFSSKLDDLVEQSGVPLWIFGHTHYNTEFTLGATRVLTNQRGYPQEPCRGFNPQLVVGV